MQCVYVPHSLQCVFSMSQQVCAVQGQGQVTTHQHDGMSTLAFPWNTRSICRTHTQEQLQIQHIYGMYVEFRCVYVGLYVCVSVYLYSCVFFCADCAPVTGVCE